MTTCRNRAKWRVSHRPRKGKLQLGSCFCSFGHNFTHQTFNSPKQLLWFGNMVTFLQQSLMRQETQAFRWSDKQTCPSNPLITQQNCVWTMTVYIGSKVTQELVYKLWLVFTTDILVINLMSACFLLRIILACWLKPVWLLLFLARLGFFLKLLPSKMCLQQCLQQIRIQLLTEIMATTKK